jgi:hypothetical protein
MGLVHTHRSPPLTSHTKPRLGEPALSLLDLKHQLCEDGEQLAQRVAEEPLCL